MALENPSFETGDLTGWTVAVVGNSELGPVAVVSEAGYADSGSYAAKIGADPPDANHDTAVINSYKFYPVPGTTVTATARARSTKDKKGNAFASVGFKYTYADGTTGMVFGSEKATNELRDGFITITYAAVPPQNVVAVQMAVRGRLFQTDRAVYFDTCTISGSEITASAVELRFPTNGAVYAEGDTIPFRVTTQPGITVSALKYTITNTSTATSVDVNGTAPEFGADYASLVEGKYSVVAVATLSNGPVLTTSAHAFTVGQGETAPTKEYKASNAYTNLILRDFNQLDASMPPTAVVTGVQLDVSYKVRFLVRVKDKDVDDLEAARYSAAFSVAPSGTLSMQALSYENSAYTAVGTPMNVNQGFTLSDFSVIETGVSEEKKWVVLDSGNYTATLGSEESAFGLQEIQAGNFLDYAVALRFYPSLGSVPEYADSGDMCIRVYLNKVRIKVFFDGGSVEYYFVGQGDPNEIIKGELVASYVQEGSLKLGTAKGFMQLMPNLELVEGGTPPPFIYQDYDIHSAIPPTEKNWIGKVAADMRYNGLPTYYEVETNRSRYTFISANFYGDPKLDSIYGANGVFRGFAYNGDYFYHIATHPEEEKDRPRHLAYHHGHLALGYGSGRVDLSVVGEPYNFEGVDGASSWAIGDEVTGLLPLSGTMLGIFGRKSITGLSGTTVDNFATQVISPKLGAVEYTVTDMGFPVYANAYGIYTLSQTSEYGDFLGNPLSQQVSPWLRPRLVRSSTSSKEVVVAWPVRSKNQYKLAFADGYVLTMTMNYGNQSTPTFSKQKYFIPSPDANPYDTDRVAIVPAAVSSELDDSGEERIHIANKQVPSTPVVGCATANDVFGNAWGEESHNEHLVYLYMTNTPSWLYPTDTGFNPAIRIDFYNTGDIVPYYYASEENYGYTGWYKHGEYPVIDAPASGHGTIYSADMSQSVCFDWSIPEQG